MNGDLTEQSGVGQSVATDRLGTAAERRTIRDIARYLESDLYRREGGERGHARWKSPLGWVVLYGYADHGVRCEIIDPVGKPFAETEVADIGWLKATLP